ncbi:mannose-1-phosphate guanylyltransferase/mannose-6-phosphate isomerase [Temperatibacter marinus]|uniref:mannose-1-phosphate guanylyltransferase n=1 Tax=Temperatibacter marinus TaxID=1456591 RepID=A0AA52EHD1_9PROT|nr:mannose-1-phosphate guanylyltransferase/mannose-6-phosphate isomerase [Temperatibacter marinus]WND03183.1 mannose-1-phosphate guanylyltransferase/mannose-6-phosphate isomerase [Temperatibacter marinus]
MSKIYPVVLSGGAGTRLWPISRSKYPKQFLKIGQDESLFQECLERLRACDFLEQAIIVSNEDHRFIISQQAEEINYPLQDILLEPLAKNTAAAIAAAVAHVETLDPNAKIIILPSDHYIQDAPLFAETVSRASQYADTDNIICFGITPTFPSTGYGYLKKGPLFKDRREVNTVDSFIEKPNQETAETFMETNDYLWNSGMFLFSISTFTKEIEKYAPETLSLCKESVKQATVDLDFIRLDSAPYEKLSSISIDYAVMEKTSNILLIEGRFEWSDVGTYGSFMNKVAHKDINNNFRVGDIFSERTSESIIYSERQIVNTLGVKDLIIVSTEDVLLVADRAEEQKVGQMINAMSDTKETQFHVKVFRPWGNYHSLHMDDNYQVKKIEVYPGKRLSLQKHNFRAEHWIILEGRATITIDDKTFDLTVNESTFIPSQSTHRLENKTNDPVIMIEVQTGTYFGEDDIIRLEDDFGRL